MLALLALLLLLGCYRTPGRIYALQQLGKQKRANARAMAAGRKPTIGGKKVSAGTFTKRTGVTKSSAKRSVARQRKR